MIIAEELLLLAHDDESGKADMVINPLESRLATALLIELALMGRVASSSSRLLEVRDASSAGHPELDSTLAFVAEGPCTPGAVSQRVAPGLRDRLLECLVSREVLRRQEKRTLGVFSSTRWPAVDSTQETALRARLRSVLLDGVVPTPRESALLALSQGTWLVSRLVPSNRLTEAETRAAALAKTYWAQSGVPGAADGAVDPATAAMVTAMVVTTVIVPMALM